MSISLYSSEYIATFRRASPGSGLSDRFYYLELNHDLTDALFTVDVSKSTSDGGLKVVDKRSFRVGTKDGEYPDAKTALDAAKAHLHAHKRIITTTKRGYVFVDNNCFDPKELNEWKAASRRDTIYRNSVPTSSVKAARQTKLTKLTNEEKYNALFDGLGESW